MSDEQIIEAPKNSGTIDLDTVEQQQAFLNLLREGHNDLGFVARELRKEAPSER